MRHLTVRVTLPDSTTKALLLDSASTASDVCRQLVNKLGIKERVGFSLFISLYDKVSALISREISYFPIKNCPAFILFYVLYLIVKLKSSMSAAKKYCWFNIIAAMV